MPPSQQAAPSAEAMAPEDPDKEALPRVVKRGSRASQVSLPSQVACIASKAQQAAGGLAGARAGAGIGHGPAFLLHLYVCSPVPPAPLQSRVEVLVEQGEQVGERIKTLGLKMTSTLRRVKKLYDAGHIQLRLAYNLLNMGLEGLVVMQVGASTAGSCWGRISCARVKQGVFVCTARAAAALAATPGLQPLSRPGQPCRPATLIAAAGP